MKALKKFLVLFLVALVLFGGYCVYSSYFSGSSTDETENAETMGIGTEDVTDTAEQTEPESTPSETDGVTEAQTETETVPETETETEPETETETETETVFIPVETKPLPEGYVQVTGITLTIYDLSLSIGETRMPIVTMAPNNATDKGEIWESSDTNVATVDRYGNIRGVAAGECIVTVTSTSNGEVSAEVKVKVKAEVTEPTYIDGILIANKTYALPKSYAPRENPEATSQMWAMFAAAKTEGLNLRLQSGYRSYVDQSIIYNGYVARDGQAAADRYSARPGHSEHQTGLAFDLSTYYFEGLTEEFGNVPEGKWLAENCHKWGFIIRYPKEKEHITGYMYEPWHIRYLGVEKATAVYESGLCLEEYLNITSSYS